MLSDYPFGPILKPVALRLTAGSVGYPLHTTPSRSTETDLAPTTGRTPRAVSVRGTAEMTENSSAIPIEAMIAGPVQLVVPAEPALSRVVRLAAGGLASLTGFTIDEMEDIKIAVSEVMVALVEHGNGSPVALDFAARDTGFVVHGRTSLDVFDPDDPDLDLSRLVLDEVCVDHGMQFVDGHAEIWATIPRGA